MTDQADGMTHHQADKQTKEQDKKQADETDRRYERRRSVLWPGRLTVGRYDFQCQVWNLSLGGARIRLDLPLQIGTSVSLKLADKPAIEARIAWSRGDSMGVDFHPSKESIRELFSDRLGILGLEPETDDIGPCQ